MTANELELLVLLEEEHAEATLESLKADFTVSQVASRRLLILRAGAGESEQVETVEGVQAVFENQVPEKISTEMDLTEKLFVRAWIMRQEYQRKVRPGEGLPWDSEGFEAPDLPQE